MPAPRPGIRCRQIGDADVAAVAALLTRGFPGRGRAFWDGALAQLERREPPPGLPKYGYLLHSDGEVVGAILMICATVPGGGADATRCNLSSWYVEPAFRAYATLLISHALGRKDVTYLNVSPAPHTLPIIEAQGFARYCDGIFIAVPLLNDWFGGEAVEVLDAHEPPATRLHVEPWERDILREHAAHGCISVWCVTAEAAYPFVFRPRLARNVIPCAQLIYCRDVGDFTRFAGPLGRALARYGRPFVIVDANGPIPGLVGVYRRGNMPKYFRGPQRPRLGDLAYTEYAVLGV